MINKIRAFAVGDKYWKVSFDDGRHDIKYPVLQITFSNQAAYHAWVSQMAGNFLVYTESQHCEDGVMADFVVTTNFWESAINASEIISESQDNIDVDTFCSTIGSLIEEGQVPQDLQNVCKITLEKQAE